MSVTISLAGPRSNGLHPVEPVQEHRVVHSSRGRLRVHLPSWSGERPEEIAARLLPLPGVSQASANGLTGNVLILFNPRVTNPETLIPALLAIPFSGKAAPVQKAAPPRPVETAEAVPAQRKPFQYVTGPRRVLYRILGWASVVMAIIGAILPGIPTAPFVILAGYFFIRSSRAAHEWLRAHRLFGPILRDWEDHHGISRTTRNFAVGLILTSAAICTLLGLPLPLLLSIYAMQLIGLIIVLRLHVVDDSPVEVAAAAV